MTLLELKQRRHESSTAAYLHMGLSRFLLLGDITPTPAYGAADLQKHTVSMHFTRSTLLKERRMY